MKLANGLVFLLMTAASAWAGVVTYEEYGAVGDGCHDDRKAIVAAHAAANEKGLSVRARDGATYYIGAGTECATVCTDVDFGKAKFIVDDREVKLKDRASPLFRIVSRQQSVKLDKSALKGLKKGAKRLNVKLACACLVHVENDKIKRYIRRGGNRNNGTAQQEVLKVAADGTVDPSTPVLWDYPDVTQAIAYPIDAKPLAVKGGEFTTRANRAESRYNYHNRGFVVSRSNVTIEGMTHYVTDELDHGAPYAGFFSIQRCADVTIRDCVFTPHRTYRTQGRGGGEVPMGSYELSVNSAANVAFVNCRQTRDICDRRYWGIFGSNFCKNLLFDGCEFSRFDAHMGVAGATVRNSKLGYMGLSSIGFGTFLVENTTIRAAGFVRLRYDYGCTWDGDIIIRNCRYEPEKSKGVIAPVICGQNDGAHDFGYVCHLPHKVEIDGLFIDDSANPGKAVLFGDITRGEKPDAPYPIRRCEEIVLKNVTTASGKPLTPFAKPAAFADTKVDYSSTEGW